MLTDYVQCVKFGSNGEMVRGLRLLGGLLYSGFKHDMGPLHYSLFRFADTPKSEWGSYIRNQQFSKYVVKNRVPDDLHELVKDKAGFYQHCIARNIPTPPIICILGRSPRVSPDGPVNCVLDVGGLENALSNAAPEIFAKPIDGAHGTGTFLIRRKGHQFVFGHPERSGSVGNLYTYAQEQARKGGSALLLQPRIRPHSDLLKISSANALPTARIVTAMVDDAPQILYSCVRLSVGSSITDNFSKSMSGNLIAAIDKNTGVLSDAWGSTRTDWPVMRATGTHPDTGQPIRGAVFPCWPKVRDLALMAQNSLPRLQTVGWDIAVTEDEVLLVEANDDYCIEMIQVAYQRGLGSHLMSALQIPSKWSIGNRNITFQH